LNAQTIGYAEAVGRFGESCGADIVKYYKTANLGGGRVQQCVEQNQARASPICEVIAYHADDAMIRKIVAAI